MLVASKYLLLFLFCVNSFIYNSAVVGDLTKLFSSQLVYWTLRTPAENGGVYPVCYGSQPAWERNRKSHIHFSPVLCLADHVHNAQHQSSIFSKTFIRQPEFSTEEKEWKIPNSSHLETWLILFLSTYFLTVMGFFIAKF